MTKPRIMIRSADAIEGPLYAVQFEDSIGHCYDWSFAACGADGKRYVLRGYRIEGAIRNEEGILCPNYQAKDRALRFAERLMAKGSIDPTLWEEVPERDPLRELMDSWGAEEAVQEKEDVLFWEASGRPAYVTVRR